MKVPANRPRPSTLSVRKNDAPVRAGWYHRVMRVPSCRFGLVPVLAALGLLILPLVVPTLHAEAPPYSTYLGGTAIESVAAVAADSGGLATVVGSTGSPDFPAAPGDAGRGFFVTRFNTNGSARLYSRVFAGGTPRAMALGVDGAAFVVGRAESTGFQTTAQGAYPEYLGGVADGFVLKLSPDGSNTVFATFIGGAGEDELIGCAVEPGGGLVVAGVTGSEGLSRVASLDRSVGGSRRVFVARLNPTGSQVTALVYLGGGVQDIATGFVRDVVGNFWVCGRTSSPDFPMVSPWQGDKRGPWNAFVSRISPDLGRLLGSTFLGGSGVDAALAIAAVPGGGVWITGSTTSTDFPLTTNWAAGAAGGREGFVARLDATGQLRVSGRLSGSGNEDPTGLAVDVEGTAWVTGSTDSTDFPVVPAGHRPAPVGRDAFVAAFNLVGSNVFSAPFGGDQAGATGSAIALGSDGSLYLAGSAGFPSGRCLPVSVGAAQSGPSTPFSDYYLAADAFVARIPLGPAVASTAGFNARRTLSGTHFTTTATASAAGGTYWWSWTAPADGHLLVRAEGLAAELAIYTGGSAETLSRIPVVPSAATRAEARIRVGAGITYQVSITVPSGSPGLFYLTLELGLPVNDDWRDRIVLSGLPIATEGSNVGGTAEPGEPFHAGARPTSSVWWSWTSPIDGPVTASAEGSGFSSILAVYSGDDPGSLQEEVSTLYFNRVAWHAVRGRVYSIAVAGFQGTAGRITLALTPASTPGGDDFSGRLRISGSQVVTNGTNVDATREPGEPVFPGFEGLDAFLYAGGHSVWWEWIAPTNGSVLISTAGSSLDTRLAVFTGTELRRLELVAANDNAVDGLRTSRVLITNVVAGVDYQVLIDSTAWERPGPYRLTLSVIEPPRLLLSATPDGPVRLRLTGVLDRAYVVETAGEIGPLASWVPIATNLLSSDASWTFYPGVAGPRRFYRAREVAGE